MSTTKKAVGAVFLVILVVALFAVGLVTAYDAGRQSAPGAIDCDEGAIVSLEWQEHESGMVRTLTLGDCERIDEGAFIAAVNALAAGLAADECEAAEEVTGDDAATDTTAADTGSADTTVVGASDCPPGG